MNKYDLNHRVAHHPKMSDKEWEEAYHAAWQTYYTPEHIETILRRTAANKLGRLSTTLTTILWFYLAYSYEGVHPLEAGAFRLKFRADRRYGMPRENPLIFYPKYVGGTVVKLAKYLALYLKTKKMVKAIERSPDRYNYLDLAIAPPRDDEFETLDLYHETDGGEDALARKRRDEIIRDKSAGVPTAAPINRLAS